MSWAGGVTNPGTANAWASCVSRAGQQVDARVPSSRSYSLARIPDLTATATVTLALGAFLVRGLVWPTYTDTSGSTVVVSIVEKQGSREFSQTDKQATLTRIYLIHGSKDPAAVSGVGPQVGDVDTTYPAMTCTKRDAEPYGTADSTSGGYGLVKLTCTFTAEDDNQNGEEPQPTFSYEFGSETEHIEVALAQDQKVGLELPRDSDPGLTIGVTSDGVEGVDIESPLLVIQEEYRFNKARFSAAKRRAMFDAIKCTNSATWREWEAGEVLLDSVSATKSTSWWIVRATFKVRKNQTINLDLYKHDGTKQVLAVTKKGWQYLWIQKAIPTQIQGNDTKTQILPHAAYVATVYHETDFAAIFGRSDPLP